MESFYLLKDLYHQTEQEEPAQILQEESENINETFTAQVNLLPDSICKLQNLKIIGIKHHEEMRAPDNVFLRPRRKHGLNDMGRIIANESILVR